ncbi:adenylate/guanylate cyclase domain-containing protein [Daejeonella oryzae]|uniref:adenylate/guanylate cyclase domain-containing protein n=1 Tax=Daejeonella oryzae TaxID=1122943 RepID=UPI0004034632|nr:adenylate/guanylate cyclase domain-containing protein [Daejeonella oryzae]
MLDLKLYVFLSLYLTLQSFNSAYALPEAKQITFKQDTTEVNTLLEEGKTFFNSDPAKAVTLGLKARDMALDIKFTKGVAYALKNVGIAYYIQGDYKKTLDYWQQSLKTFQSINDELGEANLLSNIGSIYFNQADELKALEYNLKSLKVSEKINNKLRIATALVNIGAIYYNKPATHDKALKFYLRALPLIEETQDNNSLGTVNANIGEIYFENGNDSLALFYFKKSLNAYKDSENMPYALNAIGKVYIKKGDYEEAIKNHTQALGIAEKLSGKLEITQSLLGIANATLEMGDEKQAISFYKKAERLAQDIKSLYDLKDTYKGLATSYAQLNDYSNAFNYQSKLTNLKDTLYNIEADKKMAGLQYDFDIQKKQGEIDLLVKNRKLQQSELDRQRLVKNSLIAGIFFVFIIAFIIFRNYRLKVKTNKLLDHQKAQIENLLSNILPDEVAVELQRDGVATPRFYESVSVMFTDFQNFTQMADVLSPQEVVLELNACFIAFDEIIGKYSLEKIKTIGDAYMCAGGIPTKNDTHPIDIIKASLEIREFVYERNLIRQNKGLLPWELRIGINTGPVVAGVVGRKKYAYDIWGSTVNTASRMESNGVPGQVNISSATHQLIKHIYNCTYRGKIMAKNVGEIDMYFVDGEIIHQQTDKHAELKIKKMAG